MLGAAWRNDTAAVLACLLACSTQLTDDADFVGTPLHWAAYYHNAAMADALIRAGAAVNARDRLSGRTPLHWAADRDGACCGTLLEAGAEVNATDFTSWTPLHVAAYAGAADTVGHMLVFGADAGARTRSGETPLQLAAGCHRSRAAATLAAHTAAAARWAGMRRVALTAWAAGGSTAASQ